jgi:hypothetical protein
MNAGARAFALGLAVVSVATFAGAALPHLTIYMVHGKTSASILKDPDYQRVFRDSIFGGHDVTIDLSSGKARFLESLFDSQLVYLSLHANQTKYLVGSGDEVDADDIAIAYKQHGYKGPTLVVVTGCSTTKDLENTPKNLPKAFGIVPATRKRAYIGFPTFKTGLIGDRYFRVFFAQWMRARADGTHPTLEEARVAARDYIEKVRALQTEATAKIARFEAFDAATAEQITIVGDSSLRVSDIAP